MKRSERLQVVLTLVERKENDALQLFSNAQQALHAEQKRYRELEQYMSDYQTRIRQQMSAGVQVGQFANFQNFLNQLSGAMEQQQQRLELMTQQMVSARTAWQTAHQKTKGMRDHIERCRLEEKKEADKKEQAMLDEFFQQTSRSTLPR